MATLVAKVSSVQQFCPREHQLERGPAPELLYEQSVSGDWTRWSLEDEWHHSGLLKGVECCTLLAEIDRK